MKSALLIGQIILAVIITILVLLQAQGNGLGKNWTGGGETYHTRQGVEKVVFVATIVSIIIFIATSIAVLLS